MDQPKLQEKQSTLHAQAVCQVTRASLALSPFHLSYQTSQHTQVSVFRFFF
jgi:hypothetical protein